MVKSNSQRIEGVDPSGGAGVVKVDRKTRVARGALSLRITNMKADLTEFYDTVESTSEERTLISEIVSNLYKLDSSLKNKSLSELN